TVNIYLNWAPRQERSDWLAHWGTVGEKPLFFVEWGLPHISSWSSYRGPEFIWRCLAFQSLWVPEFAAAHLGGEAYRIGPGLRKALDREEELWARGEPFSWGTLAGTLRDGDTMHQEVMALFAADNWRAHRAWGISAMLPWDQGELWNRVRETPTVENPERHARLQHPGIVPDAFRPGSQYIGDPGGADAFVPSAIGKVFQRWNMPLCAFLGGRVDGHGADGPVEGSDRRFTEKRHTVLPGSTVPKSLVILNDSRRPRRCAYRWGWAGEDAAGAGRGTIEVAPGGRAFVPIAVAIPDTASPGPLELRAVFDFGEGEVQEDGFLFTVLDGRPPPPLRQAVWLLDPGGRTAACLDRLGIRHRPCPPDGAGVEAGAVLVVGERALSDPVLATARLPVLERVSEGARLLVLAQDADVLSLRFGFRVQVHGLRQLFVRDPGHPALAGLSEACFRDWAGSAEMVPPFLDTPPVEATNPTWEWCGFRNTRVWRAGNLGTVASVLIEKPPRGGWLPLLDGGFDLQYAPLLEKVDGRGRALFCQLDLVHRSEPEPVAERLLPGLLRSLADAPATAPPRRVLCSGGEDVRGLLDALGIACGPCPEILAGSPEDALLVAGPGATPPGGLRESLAAGLALLCLGFGAEDLARWLPDGPRGTPGAFAAAELAGLGEGVLRGVSPADVHWRGRASMTALDGEGHPALRTVATGKGRVVLCQAPPPVFDTQAKPYLRTTQRRSLFLVSRLLANLGAVGESRVLRRPVEVAARTDWPLPSAWLGRADPEDVGNAQRWWQETAAGGQWKSIAVPGTFESQFPELVDYDGLFWYRLRFRPEPGFGGDDVTLYLGGIDDESWVWLNGAFLGEVTKDTRPDDYWSFPREYRLPQGLLRQDEENALVVRVRDTYRTGGIQGVPRLYRTAPWLRS
ncbi:MAG: hypothetical protein JXR77_18540, partial [Lentisphaeria bacterium]|nr:hypothetical protein [Lentisphaeria bacterium]